MSEVENVQVNTDDVPTPVEVEVDTLLKEVEAEDDGKSTIIPMHDVPPAAPVETTVADTPAQEYEYKANGKTIKEPIDMILKRASMGYDYASQTDVLKQERELLSQRKAEAENLASRYGEIDKFARDNPQWKTHLEESWANRGHIVADESFDADDPMVQRMQGLEASLNTVKDFIQESRDSAATLQARDDDNRLATEIKSIRTEHSNIDFDRADEAGKSVEYRVLEHARTNGIGSFRAAFRDLYHDKLVGLASEKEKVQTVVTQQAAKKEGLLGQSPAPILGLQDASNVKDKSYEDLLEEAKKELGI